MNYEIKLQKTRAGKVCICIVSAVNGKLVLKGESIQRRIDALSVINGLRAAMGLPDEVVEVLPWNHRWPKNAGKPKKGN